MEVPPVPCVVAGDGERPEVGDAVGESVDLTPDPVTPSVRPETDTPAVGDTSGSGVGLPAGVSVSPPPVVPRVTPLPGTGEGWGLEVGDRLGDCEPPATDPVTLLMSKVTTCLPVGDAEGPAVGVTPGSEVVSTSFPQSQWKLTSKSLQCPSGASLFTQTSPSSRSHEAGEEDR